MNYKISSVYTLTLLISLFSYKVLAYNNHDFQSWNTLIINKELIDNFTFTNEAHLRVGYDASRLTQSLIRPSFSYKANKVSSLSLGYTWVYNKKPFTAKNTNEHNVWQQLLLNYNYKDISLSSRSRVEERFIQRNPKVGWRYRQLFNVKKPVNNNIIDFISVYDELFIQVNNTSSNSNNSGVSENRLYLGVGKKVSSQATLELGYQNQFIKKYNQSNYYANMIVILINTKLM